MKITLRLANWEDSSMILDWRNEPTTVPWMGSVRALSFKEHDSWFKKVLEDKNCLFFIIEADAKPVGQIRYHKNSADDKNLAKVSINITYRMHGKGIASVAFREGSKLVRQWRFADQIFAYVQLDNIGSIRAMEKAGYVRQEIVEKHGIPHLIMLDEGR